MRHAVAAGVLIGILLLIAGFLLFGNLEDHEYEEDDNGLG